MVYEPSLTVNWFLFFLFRYHLSTLEQKYMSEALQPKNTRSLAAHSHSSSESRLKAKKGVLSDSSHPKHVASSSSTVSSASSSASSEQCNPTGSLKRKHKLRLSAGFSSRYKLLQISKWYNYS